MRTLSHHDITTLLLAIAVLLAVSRILGEIAQRFNQPAVLGEILAGILLGPTVFGALFPNLHLSLFPREGPVALALHGLATFAITLFLLVAGMEVDLSILWRQGRAAFAVGVSGIVIPFALGFVPAWFFPKLLGAPGDADDKLVFALFMATAMSITALPVIAKILMDLNLFRSDIGVTIIAAAIFNDLIGWIIFAFVLAMIGTPDHGLSIWQTAGLTLLFTAFTLTVVRWGVNRVLPWIQAHTSWPGGVLGFALSMALLCAAFTEGIGIHAVFGSFMFGIAMGDSTHLRKRTRTTIEQFVSFIFAPLFFATIGLRVDFVRNFDLGLVVFVLVIATVGKVFGCTAAARWMGFPANEARAVGYGMNARGAMEIILGLLALNAGIIGERLFVALVVMALVTSMTSGMLIQSSFKRRKSVRFVDFLTSKTFIPALDARDRLDALTELSTVAAAAANVDTLTVVNSVWTRERLVTSAMGRGVAVPHARIKDLKAPIVAVGLSHRGIDFDAPDGAPTKVIILILTPQEEMNNHLSILASIARTFHSEWVAERMLSRVSSFTELRAFMNIEMPRGRETT